MAADSNKFPFTIRRLEALPTPTAGRKYYYDTRTPGLALCITATGSRTYYLYKWHEGRPVRMRLARFDETALDRVQKRVRNLTGRMPEGFNPQAERQAARHEQTIKGLWEFWFETHAKRKKRTWAEDERKYNNFLKRWASRGLSAVKKGDVQALHARIGEKNGVYAANRVLALLRAMFNKAPDMGYTGDNPTEGVKMFPEEKRDRFLHGDELKAFFKALGEEPDELVRDFLLTLLLTGARRSNVQEMRWEEVDFDLALWRIPDTKSKRPVVVPLTSASLTVLRGRQAAAKGSTWVFPSYGKTGHLVEPKGAWKRIVDRAGLKDIRPHDLRRSLGSWMAITGAGLPVVGKMLGHTQQSTTQIYARLTVDPVRQAAESATTAMLAAGNLTIIESNGGQDNE